MNIADGSVSVWIAFVIPILVVLVLLSVLLCGLPRKKGKKR